MKNFIINPFYVFFELLKNSMKATMIKYGKRADLLQKEIPEIKGIM